MIPLLVGTFDHNPDERDQARFNPADLLKEPEAQVRRDLVVPRPTCVQLPA